MVMSYIGNEQQWKMLIEVDWLGQYIKAWIAFNAWYRNSFALNRDREIIDAIKNDSGHICSKIEDSLSGNSSSEKSFQSNVADLHGSLSGTIIKSMNKRISFEAIEDYRHAKPVAETKNNISYKIEVDIDRSEHIVQITNSNGREILCETIRRGNSLDTQQLTYLSDAQKETLQGFLKESTPVHNLLVHDSDFRESNHREIGSFKFVDNTNLIARAIIEILYQLRNALFHGEITPDSETQEVYQPAYLILKSIIPGA